MNIKAILIGLVFAPIATFAANPPECIPPKLLHLAAQQNRLHSFEHVASCKDLKLNEWYLDDSADYFNKDMQALLKYNDWKVGPNGASNGYAVKCSYYSPSMPASSDDIVIEKMHLCIDKK